MNRLIFAVAAVSSLVSFAQPRPFVIFVRGFQPESPTVADPLTNHLPVLRDYLTGQGAEVLSVTWNCFRDGAAQGDCPANDAQLLQDLGAAVDAQPEGRPVILIGHSFGGDSVLKAVAGWNVAVPPRIHRPVTAVVTLDPVGEGGFRTPLLYNPIPSGVGLFFNRWQTASVPPLNAVEPGRIACNAADCNQAWMENVRACDGSTLMQNVCLPRTTICAPTPLRATHNGMLGDSLLSHEIITELHERLTSRRLVSLTSVSTGRVLSPFGGGGGGLTTVPWIGGWETVEIVSLEGGTLQSGHHVWLRVYNGHSIGVSSSGTVEATARTSGANETFTIVKVGGGPVVAGDTVTLRDASGRSLAVTKAGVGVLSPLACAQRPADCRFVLGGKPSDVPQAPPSCR